MIIGLILVMYIWIYIYVRMKFHGFENLGDSSYASEVQRRSAMSNKSNDGELRRVDVNRAPAQSVPASTLWHPRYQSDHAENAPVSDQLQPWDHMNFITEKPLQNSIIDIPPEDEAVDVRARGSNWSGDTHIAPLGAVRDKPISAQPQDSSSKTNDGHSWPAGGKASLGKRTTKPSDTSQEPKDALKETRAAIRKQLRYLFIYPLVYIVMWSFPFASHALNYSTYYVQHPVFWLSLVQTMMLSLQAGVDSILFSCSEKPWRRVDPNSKFSVPFIRRRSKALLQRRDTEKSTTSVSEPAVAQQPSEARNPTWWEAEGRRRNDSVWLGTSTLPEPPSPVLTKTRSKSPQKTRRSLHSRGRSSGQGHSFVPQLEPISPGTVSFSRRPTLRPGSSDGSPGGPSTERETPSGSPGTMASQANKRS